jgi:hypothetical protein
MNRRIAYSVAAGVIDTYGIREKSHHLARAATWDEIWPQALPPVAISDWLLQWAKYLVSTLGRAGAHFAIRF